MRNKIGIIIFILLAVFSVGQLFYRTSLSTELSTQTTETSSRSRTDYIDPKGRITFAADRGYATVVKELDDGHVVLEQYLDEKGRAVTLPSGFSQIKREYEAGRNTIIEYLDTNGDPVVINNGYDSIHRSYNAQGLSDTDTYWIGDTQVERKQGYWQYQRVYTDEKISEIRYLDREGNLQLNSFGYALIRRSYDGNATIDLYFDTKNNPASSKLGQYGKKTEKEDDIQFTTYLGMNGEAANTTEGYAIIKRDGAKTLYYDQDGNPVTIGRNQFGILKVGRQSVYLDEDGEPMFRLDNFLNTHPAVVLVLGILLTGLAVAVKGKGRIVLIILYVAFIGLMTIAYREAGDPKGQFELFWSYKQFFSSAMIRQNILNNIWLFVPLGAALYRLGIFGWIWAVVLSVVIELVQLIFGIGLCELDDVISNGLGALIGFGAAYSWNGLFHKDGEKTVSTLNIPEKILESEEKPSEE